ncbi:MAG: hypothetical protein KTR18_03130 [Acidiferrobacterales bacterium]|nr:hypothetical protein [Acidiferrobacterales bacterium]
MIDLVKKWSILVGLNSIVPFAFAIISQHNGLLDLLAMFLGIATFVFFYSKLDQILLLTGKHELRKSLFWAAILKIFTQLYPVIEISAGAFSIKIVESMIGKTLFFSTYFKTILEGVLLSVAVAVFMLVIKLIVYLRQIMQ